MTAFRAGGTSSKLVRPSSTLRTMQLNAWVADNFMNIKILSLPLILSCYNPKISKNHTTLCSFCTALYLVSITINGMCGWPIILHLLICLFYLL